MLKILYYPPGDSTNAYVSRFKNLLSSFGDVGDFNFKKTCYSLFLMNFRKVDYIFVNWLESGLINAKGQITLYTFLRTFIKFLVMRLKAKNIIFVKHNHYPHHTLPAYIKLAKKLMYLLQLMSNYIVVHSSSDCAKNDIYIPHPLYNRQDGMELYLPEQVSDEKSFICFGRIVPYKKIEMLIKSFPNDRNLIIAGNCEDTVYLEKLKSIAGSNVSFMSEFIGDNEARQLLLSTEGLIISHSEEDMIVSGSFFYALTVGVRVLCLNTNFLKWAENTLGSHVVECFSSIDEMVLNLTNLPPRSAFDSSTLQLIEEEFGDRKIIDSMSLLFNK